MFSRIKRLQKNLAKKSISLNRKSEIKVVELYLSEHENKIVVVIDESMTGSDFLTKAVDQLEEAGDIRSNKLATMFAEVKANEGRQFLVNYAQVPLGVPAVLPTSIVSFQGKGKNGSN